MSDLIRQVDALRELKKQSSSTNNSGIQNGHSNKEPIPAKQSTEKDIPLKGHDSVKEEAKKETTEKVPDKPSVQQKNSGFGGMKKGFLFGGTSKPKQSNSAAKTDDQAAISQKKKTLEDIPFIKKNDEAKSENLRFSEVQNAMEKTTAKLIENKEWVTDDLLNKLEKNEKLTKRLQDPMFIQAIGEFQRNPQEAMRKYGNNKEVQEFFQDFCGLMGDHFNNLSDKMESGSGNSSSSSSSGAGIVTAPPGSVDMQVHSSTNPKQPTAQDEAKMQQILSDPEVRFILMDPKIQELFEHLRNDPAKGQRLLQQASGELKQKIHKLVSVGLLQFQTS